ncbi:hypothetical protein Z043_121954 [Scleropages formosus]|uniref:Uncharacterized protein n=1 Tax=Scleropages formosus TaxID=113540 RepID=A0A0N8JW65_SCLFO|nr:hypothetical protein Z043_121954 [Scleropages formosus]
MVAMGNVGKEAERCGGPEPLQLSLTKEEPRSRLGVVLPVLPVLLGALKPGLPYLRRTWSYSLREARKMSDVTFSKQWIHFLRSDF